VIVSLGLAALLLRLLMGPLNLYHLVGLLLVAGIGLDYALFLGRGGADARHAVGACAASTVGAFLVLATSSIPALHALGASVSTGAALCYLAASWGARPGDAGAVTETVA
jgi:predicted exporter